MEEDKQKELALLEQEEQELKKQMKKAERKHKPYLLLYHLSNALISFGKKGILLFSDGLGTAALRLLFRAPLILILWGIKQEVLFILGGYVATQLCCWGGGTLLLKLSVKLLDRVETDVLDVYSSYLCNRYSKYDILGDYVTYDDGTTVQYNEIIAPMRQSCCEMFIYRKDEPEESSTYYQRMYSSEDNGVSINKHIASVQFDNKFGIIVEKGTENEAMVFLSPTLQVSMANTPEMLVFKQMKIADGAFSAIIGEPIPHPSDVNVYQWRTLTRHMKEIDKYCAKVRERADEAHMTMVKIDFIRGR